MIQGNYTVADKCKFIIFQKTNNLSSLSSTFLIHMPRFFMLMLCIFCWITCKNCLMACACAWEHWEFACWLSLYPTKLINITWSYLFETNQKVDFLARDIMYSPTRYVSNRSQVPWEETRPDKYHSPSHTLRPWDLLGLLLLRATHHLQMSLYDLGLSQTVYKPYWNVQLVWFLLLRCSLSLDESWSYRPKFRRPNAAHSLGTSLCKSANWFAFFALGTSSSQIDSEALHLPVWGYHINLVKAVIKSFVSEGTAFPNMISLKNERISYCCST